MLDWGKYIKVANRFQYKAKWHTLMRLLIVQISPSSQYVRKKVHRLNISLQGVIEHVSVADAISSEYDQLHNCQFCRTMLRSIIQNVICVAGSSIDGLVMRLNQPGAITITYLSYYIPYTEA